MPQVRYMHDALKDLQTRLAYYEPATAHVLAAVDEAGVAVYPAVVPGYFALPPQALYQLPQ